MRNNAGGPRNGRRKALVAIASLMLLAVMLFVCVVATSLRAQSTVRQAPPAQLLRFQVQAEQSPSAQADRPSFDVASIKPNRSGVVSLARRTQPGGRYAATGITLNGLITFAYQLKPQQLSGLPEWGDSEHFDIEAKAQGNPTMEQIWLMIQSLLADRFRLVVHYETRQLPMFALVLSKVGKSGPQLQRHSDDTKCTDPSAGPPPAAFRSDAGLPSAPCGGFSGSGGAGSLGIAGQKITMDMLAGVLSRQLDRVVVNQTELSGFFDESLEFAPPPRQFGPQLGADTSASDSSGPPSIFTALQDQLGLKLEATKGPVDVLVIDHVEEPTPN